MTALYLTAEYARSLLSYDRDSGDLRWLPRLIRKDNTRSDRSWNAQNAGKIAGYINSHGYIILGVYGRRYKAHRVIWLIETGRWPTHDIDHRNLHRADNRWDNLREATSSQNNRNLPINAKNTSGFKGVSFKTGHGKWEAKITVDGKSIYLGEFDEPSIAHEAYVAAARRHFGDFARVA